MTAFPPEASSDSLFDKASLRHAARLRRSTLDRTALASALIAQFAALPEFTAAHEILIYLASGDEIDIDSLAAEFPDRHWYAPRCLPGNHLAMHRFVPGETTLVLNRLGIREPAPHTATVEPSALELVVVPGLLFTPGGHRLGYGGGYYDRLLPRLSPACTFAALVPNALFVDRLPTDPWDVPMDIIVTETRIFRPMGRRMRYIERNETDSPGTKPPIDAA